VISFAEVHAAFARKYRNRELTTEEFERLRQEFRNDWIFGLTILDLESPSRIALPKVVETYPLKGGDAIHLSVALGLKATFQAEGGMVGHVDTVEFGVADRKIAEIADQCGFTVFNPEDEN
jgi:hypothetical protein